MQNKGLNDNFSLGGFMREIPWLRVRKMFWDNEPDAFLGHCLHSPSMTHSHLWYIQFGRRAAASNLYGDGHMTMGGFPQDLTPNLSPNHRTSK